MPRHSWEDVEASEPDTPRHSWENAADAAAPQAVGDSDGEPCEPTPAAELTSYLLALLLSRGISAKDFCIVMHWASLAGVPDVKKYGYKPGAPSGHYLRHLREVLPVFAGNDELYGMEMPTYDKDSLGRATHNLQVLPPHEEVNADLQSEPGTLLRLEEAKRDDELPPCYYNNPIVRSTDEPVLPLSMYIDAVPYSNTDSVIGVWFVNMVSGRRYLSAVIRKSKLCKCGCRGWCSVYAIFSMVRWSLECLAIGRFPAMRHDNTPWTEQDDKRASMSGAQMVMRCALIFLKGDWAEYASTLGFPSWADNLRPCFGCNISRDDLTLHEGVGPLQSPWRNNEEGDYNDACQRCERTVALDASAHQSIIDAGLQYDKRRDGSKGRRLLEHVPRLGLCAGDRLEPSVLLPNVAKFESLNAFPVLVSFWRCSNETMARHRNPLFCTALGLSPHSCLTVDFLHSLFLGVMHVYCRHVLWFLIEKGVWGRMATEEETVQVVAIALRHELNQWYKRRHAERPTEKLTRVDLTRSKIGDFGDRKLKTKAAETYGILHFLLHTMDGRAARLGAQGARHKAAGQALADFVQHFESCKVVLTPAEVQRAYDLYQRHLALTDEFGDMHIPKRHVLFHALDKLGSFGNPRFYSNWYDESLNRMLKLSCRTLSQTTFEQTVLLSMRAQLCDEGRSRKRKR